MIKINADAGADLKTVMPQPRYIPLRPACFQYVLPSAQKLACGPAPTTEAVCMRDLIVSAGKNRKLYDIPADAPDTACCHNGSAGRLVPCSCGGAVPFFSLCLRKSIDTVSLLPNQAAPPPDSRIKVPICPCQKPMRPWCLKTLRMMAGMVRCFVIAPSTLGTCILHFMSSTGVRTSEVIAPATPPVKNKAERGNGASVLYSPDANSSFWTACSETNRLLFSNAAPTSGALIPLYRPAMPSWPHDCLKQSTGPVYRRGM